MKTTPAGLVRWIPCYRELLQKNKLLAVAARLKITKPHAVGLVMVSYLWLADQVTPQQRIDDDAVIELPEDAEAVFDLLVDQAGFYAAMCKVGWFIPDDQAGTMRVINYFEKNGTLAMKRAADQQRQQQKRLRDSAPCDEERHGGEEPVAGEKPAESQKACRRETTGTEGRVGRDASVTHTGQQRDDSVTESGRVRDPHTHEQQREQHHHNYPGTSVRSGDGSGGGCDSGKRDGIDPNGAEGRKLVELLVGQGIRAKAARSIVRYRDPMVVAYAAKMGIETKRNGWDGNIAGYIVNRINDDSAAEAVERKRNEDTAIAARNWARAFLEKEAGARAAVVAEVRQRETKLWHLSDLQICTILPPVVMVVLGKLMAAWITSGEFTARDVSPAFNEFLAKLGGGP